MAGFIEHNEKKTFRTTLKCRPKERIFSGMQYRCYKRSEVIKNHE